MAKNVPFAEEWRMLWSTSQRAKLGLSIPIISMCNYIKWLILFILFC